MARPMTRPKGGLRRRLLGGVDEGTWDTERHVVCVHCNARFGAKHLPYTFAPGKVGGEVAEAFVELTRDDTSTEFLKRAIGTPRWMFWLQARLATVLRRWLSLTDANALIGRGDMFVLSTAHARRLLGDRPGGVLLDVGAGSGSVTAQLAPLFDHVIATEASGPMVRRLQRRGYTAYTGEDLSGVPEAAERAGVPLGPGGTVDCIALLNVLDRCDSPRTLLAELRQRLRPGTGRLLIAVVLPFRPFVERGTRKVPPKERLPLSTNATWEASVGLMWEHVLKPAGFNLEAAARVPYISQGDAVAPVYVLDDAVFVLRHDGSPDAARAADLAPARVGGP